jgi:NAD(P)-dependent dehydrogenase (short-subunit alcohol dehydrogenase family)
VAGEVPVDPAGVYRPHATQQVHAAVGDGDLQRAPVRRVRLALDVAGGLDAVYEAARRGGAQDHLSGQLVDPPSGLPVERPQQVVPGEIGQAGGGQVTIVITGASSGFGALSARALADAGHTVYAGMRDAAGRNAPQVAAAKQYAAENDVDLRTLELDVSAQDSVDGAVEAILSEQGSLDVLVHNAGHMVTGPAEAFTPDQLAEIYDTNVLGTQRLNRAALPHLRARRQGLVLWVGSSSTRGGTPPYLAPYFAAKAGMDAMAVSYAAELARFGIETSIIVPGAFTSGTNHFAHSGHPADERVAAEYEALYPQLMERVGERLADLTPDPADIADVAAAIVRVVDMPHGRRPFRVHIDPADDGAAVVNAVADRIRVEFLTRIGLEDLLHPHAPATR